MKAYHVVTDRPMTLGQEILFDQDHHSGVYQRVQAKLDVVNDIYAHPEQYAGAELEYPVMVALRELALEEVRQAEYPQYPSRMACLYVSRTLHEAEDWAKYFAEIGRPTYFIAEMEVEGRCFIGDAAKCFDGGPDHEENLRMARRYWENKTEPGERTIDEMLVDGKIRIAEIVQEINANLNQE